MYRRTIEVKYKRISGWGRHVLPIVKWTELLLFFRIILTSAILLFFDTIEALFFLFYNIISSRCRNLAVRFVSYSQCFFFSSFFSIKGNCANPKALGMESGRIPDDAITASSIFSDAYKPSYGRLRKSLGSCSWTCEKDALATSCWHKVDLGLLTKVTGISTQGGCIHGEWITTYEIMYSCDDNMYTYYKEQGQPKVRHAIKLYP